MRGAYDSYTQKRRLKSREIFGLGWDFLTLFLFISVNDFWHSLMNKTRHLDAFLKKKKWGTGYKEVFNMPNPSDFWKLKIKVIGRWGHVGHEAVTPTPQVACLSTITVPKRSAVFLCLHKDFQMLYIVLDMFLRKSNHNLTIYIFLSVPQW